MKNMKNTGIKTKEFPLGKERYCPRCYFGEPPTFEGRVILREDCPHNKVYQEKDGGSGCPKCGNYCTC